MTSLFLPPTHPAINTLVSCVDKCAILCFTISEELNAHTETTELRSILSRDFDAHEEFETPLRSHRM